MEILRYNPALGIERPEINTILCDPVMRNPSWPAVDQASRWAALNAATPSRSYSCFRFMASMYMKV